MKNMNYLIVLGIAVLLAMVVFVTNAQEKNTRSVTLTAPAANELVYTNLYEPNILYSICLSWATAVTGRVEVGFTRSNRLYAIRDFTMAGQTNAIIECKRGLTLNATDTINIDVTATSADAQAIVNSWR